MGWEDLPTGIGVRFMAGWALFHGNGTFALD